MKIKTVLKLFMLGASIGFLSGVAQAIRIISSHRYFQYRMSRLILFQLTASANRGIILGIGTTALFILLILILSLIWRKVFSLYFEFKLSRKNTAPLTQGAFLILIFVYLAFQIFRYARNPFHTQSFLGHSLLVLSLFLLFMWLSKKDLQSRKSKSLSLFQSVGIKIAVGVILSVFILLNILTLSQKVFARPAGPNVLLLVVDTLRADHLGCYGYTKPTSPHIDSFAEEALVFEKALTCAPWTKPSMGSLFTSLHPHEHQAFYWEDNLDNSYLTLAEVFRNNNYSTFAVQTNAIIRKMYNFHQGFQTYHEILQEKAENVVERFDLWLRKNKNKPFFVYLHFMDTHLPYNAPSDFKKIFEPVQINSVLNEYIDAAYEVRVLNRIGLSELDKQHFVNLYDAEIRYFDHHFGLICERLKDQGQFKKTLIILTSDHGEEFWEHNGSEHGHSLYKEVLHVPLIFKYSSKLQARQIKSYVQLNDLFSTILSLSGIEDKSDLIGENLLLHLTEDTSRRKQFFFEGIGFGAEKKGILKDGWKLIKNTGKRSPDALDLFGDFTKYLCPVYEKGFELYNINEDFPEKHNLIGKHPQVAGRLKTYLNLFESESFDSKKTKKTDLEKKLRDLKSLGYIK